MPARIPNRALAGRWNWLRNGNLTHQQNTRGISGSNSQHPLRHPIAESKRDQLQNVFEYDVVA